MGYEKKDDNGATLTEKMSYASTEIHRVVKGMYMQAGDLSKIYGK
jgi:cyclophilin family peptidyl-prolyl cis-trans isomerase